MQGLISLDVSHNYLCNVQELLSALKPLQKLRNLMITGNPFCLDQSTPNRVLDGLKQLVYLDGHSVVEAAGHKGQCCVSSNI